MSAYQDFNFRNPDYTAEFARRANNLKRIRENPELVPKLMAYYRLHIADFICDWGMTADPRNAERGLPVVIPLILFPKQREWINWVLARWQGQEDGLTEKSRDMGVSWLSVALGCSLGMLYKDLNIGYGSRKEEYVDKSGDPKSLFHKARQYMELMPAEFTGGWSAKANSNHMIIKFPTTGATLTGEAGDNIGRGNRAAIYFKDESAFYERPQLIDAALSQTSNCKIDLSTVNGTGNPFYKKRHGGKIPVFTFHWRDDPRKDEAWYQKQCDTLDPVIVAQEIDIDYSASVEGVVIPGKWVQAAVNLHEKLGLIPSGAKRTGLDVADEEGKDDNSIACGTGVCVTDIESWKGLDTTQTAHKALGIALAHGSQWVSYDAIGVGAGVRGASKGFSIPFVPITVSESPAKGFVIDNPDLKNVDFYLNLRAQLWWELRVRCQRAYQHLNGIREWALDEMVSIPNHPKLITQLSQPLYFITSGGKIQIESKKDMAKRGVASPNEAEAVTLYYAPIPRKYLQRQQHAVFGNTSYRGRNTMGALT